MPTENDFPPTNPLATAILREDAPLEAALLNHPFIGTEHVMIALTRAEEGYMARLLAYIGTRPKPFRDHLRRMAHGWPEGMHRGALPPTPRLGKALRRRATLLMGQSIGERDLLLAILDAGPGVAVRTLEELGFTSADLSAFVLADPGPEAPRRQSIEMDILEHSLNEIGEDLVVLARAGRVGVVAGRQREQLAAMRAVGTATRRVAILVGPAGSGKTSVVHGLAARLADDAHPLREPFAGKRIVRVTYGQLAMKRKGDLLKLCQVIFAAAARLPDVILFLDDLHQFFAPQPGGMDLGALVIAAMLSDRIALIGATTPEAFDRISGRDPSLARHLELIPIASMSPEEALAALTAKQATLSAEFGIPIEDDALAAAVTLATRFRPADALPASAIDLLIAACKRAGYSRLTASTTGRSGPRVVSASVVRDALAEHDGIAHDTLERDFADRLLYLADTLDQRVIGQRSAMVGIAAAIRHGWSSLRDPRRPRAVILLGGPTGTGKTLTAHELARALFDIDDPEHCHVIEMSDFVQPAQATALIGAPPGFTGSDREGLLTGWLRKHPDGVILFDEIERAHPQVRQLLLNLFAEGMITDGQNRAVSAHNAILLLTSNILPDQRDLLDDAADQREAAYRQTLGQSLTPEFVNRIDRVLLYRPFDTDAVRELLQIGIDRTARELDSAGNRLHLELTAFSWLYERAITDGGNARSVARVLARDLEEPIAQLKLREVLVPGTTILIRRAGDQLAVELGGQRE